MELSSVIPKEVLKLLEQNAQISRDALSEKAGISDRKAGEYIAIYRSLNQINIEDFTKDINTFTQDLIEKLRKESLIKESTYRNPFKGKIEESAVLLWGDSHIGKKNIFYDLELRKNVTTYSTAIFVEEANRLVDSIHQVIQLLSNTYKIPKLYVYFIGDIIDNDLIFKGQRFFIDACAGEQLWIGVKVISDVLSALLEIFEEIEVVSVPGNHGRKAFYEAQPTSNNFDYHLMKIIDVVFKSNDRINFIIPNSWNYLHKIYDWKYYLHHGNDIYSWMSLPYYGIVRKSKARMNEINFDKEIIGHFHTDMKIPVSSKAETIVNASWINRENFAWEKFGVYSKATQRFFGVNKKRPETWSFKLDL